MNFSTADLFYFLESSHLNMLLIKYKVKTQARLFTITEVYAVQLKPSFFNYIINNNNPFFKWLVSKDTPFIQDNGENYNKKKTRWQGNLNLTHLRKFLNQNEVYGHIEKIKLNNFNFCGIDIKPLKLSY